MGAPVRKPSELARREALTLLVLLALTGCGQTCTPATAVGRYAMQSTADTYGLSLSKDGSGSISHNEKTELISWEWTNEQVFLHLSRELLDDLDNLAGHRAPADVANYRSGYFGLDPECHAGKATKLALGDTSLSFSRIE
jgi:hypothetical protein